MRGTLPKVLYIMGTGRSGSTILDVLLSDNEGVVGCGELNYLFREGFAQNNECSCGAVCRQCELWGKVYDHGEFSGKDTMELFNLMMSVEYHSKFPQLFFKWISKSAWDEYRDVNEDLLEAVHKASGASVVVDSSKYPGRALALRRALGNNVKIVFLSREADGVMRSFQKQGIEQTSKSPFKVMLYYNANMLMGKLVMKSFPDSVLPVTFEELTTDTVATLGRIGDWAGVDLSSSIGRVERGEYLTQPHIVRGNRLRKSKQIKFIPREKGVGARPVSHYWVPVMNAFRKALGI
jgi:hypothetical protein